MATIAESVHVLAVLVAPLKDRVLVPCEDPKPEPLIVTGVPSGPEVGEMAVIVGPCAPARLPQIASPSTKLNATARKVSTLICTLSR
jgi:hypothetical protein